MMKGTPRKLALHSTLRVAALSTLLIMALAGCTTIYEGKYAYDEGWRVGEIEKVGAPADLGRFVALCQQGVGQSSAPQLFAVVRFDFGTMADKYMHSGRKLRHVVVPLPAGSTLRKDTPVYVNIHDCEQPLVPVAQLDSQPLQLPRA